MDEEGIKRGMNSLNYPEEKCRTTRQYFFIRGRREGETQGKKEAYEHQTLITGGLIFLSLSNDPEVGDEKPRLKPVPYRLVLLQQRHSIFH